jgi:hypothetical protein
MSEILLVADLIGSTVRDANGATLGKVVDIVATAQPPHELLELEVGATAWLDRLNVTTLTKRGRFPTSRQRIPWARVARIDGYTIHLAPEDR